VVTYGSLALGARIEIDSLDLSLARVSVKLSGLQVANPGSPAKNLFRASQVQLDRVLSADVRKGKKHSIGWLQRLQAVSVAGDAGRQAWTIVCRRVGEPDR
jgi:hypothetical protein